MASRALIIGSSSMLGQALQASLVEAGVEVLSCGRSSANDVYLDLGNPELPELPAGLNVDVIYHCASAFADDSLAGCLENETVNALSAYVCAEMAGKLGASQLVYAGTLSSVAPEGLGSYGASKLRAENILEWSLSKRAIAFTSLRFPQLFDDFGECCRHQLWFGRIVAYAHAGKVLRMPGGNARRNFLHISDAAVLMMSASDNKVQGRLAVSHPESITCEQIAQWAYAVFGQGGNYVVAEEKRPFQALYVPESRQSFEALGYWPKVSMQLGLERIRDHGEPSQFGPMDVD